MLAKKKNFIIQKLTLRLLAYILDSVSLTLNNKFKEFIELCYQFLLDGISRGTKKKSRLGEAEDGLYIEKKIARRFDNRQILFNILFSRGVFFMLLLLKKLFRVIIE